MTKVKICYGCMKKTENETGFCKFCGFDYRDYMSKKESYYLNPGQVLYNRYIVGKVLGAGGFGVSYIGYDKTLQIKVAIKEYFPVGYVSRNTTEMTHYSSEVHPVQNVDFYQLGLEKFLSEARRLARFNKVDGIVSITDFFHENGTGYMIMEYLPGQSLKKIVLSKTELLKEEDVLQMLSPIMDALEIIHRDGVIHRDISPDNILMNDSGKLTLIDFGAAKDLSNKNNSLAVVLKHGYAPLEQYSTSGLQGSWTDVYALCATMYYMITHAVPEEAPERASNDRQLSLKELGMPVSLAFSDMLEKGMAVHEKDRFRTVGEMRSFYERQKKAKEVKTVLWHEGNTENEKNISLNIESKKEQNKRGTGCVAVAGGVLFFSFILIALVFLFRGNYRSETVDNEQEQTIGKAEKEMEKMSGTYVTYKSLYLNNVPIYEQPQEDEVYAMIPEAQCVQVLGKVIYGEDIWYKVDYCGKQGWLEEENVRFLSWENLYCQIGENGRENVIFVNEEKIKLHTEPRQESAYAGKGIKYGTEFIVEELQNGWGKINYEGQDCWIDMNVVNNYPTEYWQIEICNGSSREINLRKKADERTKSLGKIPVGTVVRAVECKNGWGKVVFGEKIGWIKLHFATPCLQSGLERSEDLEGI